MKNVIVIGGGAAGFFSAIHIKENNPNFNVTILEKGKEVLQKVRISGGGRCNVTHACFTPKELISFYPRGKKELLGPFHQFMCGDTMEWFESKGVPLKIEADNRVFPVSNSSQSIIDCLFSEVTRLQIEVKKSCGVLAILPKDNTYAIQTKTATFIADFVVFTPGSSEKMWTLIQQLGHTVIPTVPSLFTFNIKDKRIEGLPGLAVQDVTVTIKDTKFSSQGPLLITHWGMSGPAILKLSAFGARILSEKNYQYQVLVNWLSDTSENVKEQLIAFKNADGKVMVNKRSPFEKFPKRLWASLIQIVGITETTRWAALSTKTIEKLTQELVAGTYHAQGKSTFKEEFVTAGGIDLKEVNFKRFESKILPNFFFAGEILNIDAVTGGFNFQNAWTGGYIIGKSVGN